MIIKCPECGHQVSDKAPICPSCGVEIAGHIIKCSNCGELYLKEDGMCPNCHYVAPQTISHPNITISKEEVISEANITIDTKDNQDVIIRDTENSINERQATSEVIATTLLNISETEGQEERSALSTAPTPAQTIESDYSKVEDSFSTDDVKGIPNRRSHKSLIIAIAIAILAGIIFLFIYKKTKPNTEAQEYELALKSNDLTLLNKYLENFPEAPINHRKMISTLLSKNSSSIDTDNWNNIIKINTREAYQQYLAAHPNTPHKKEIMVKLDELDWQKTIVSNTEKAYLDYLTNHPNGIHKHEAEEKLKMILVKPASKDEQAKAIACVRQLLVGMNTRSKDKITGAVASQLNFLGASGATAQDIIKYMNDKLYQADVKTINWHLGSSDEIVSTVGTDSTIQIKMPAKLIINRKGGKVAKNYIVKATIKLGRINKVTWN